jgi:hypothetical protein
VKDAAARKKDAAARKSASLAGPLSMSPNRPSDVPTSAEKQKAKHTNDNPKYQSRDQRRKSVNFADTPSIRKNIVPMGTQRAK